MWYIYIICRFHKIEQCFNYMHAKFQVTGFQNKRDYVIVLSINFTRTGDLVVSCLSHLSIFGKLLMVYNFISGDTYTDEFMFPLSTCTCTADITHGSYSMEFF